MRPPHIFTRKPRQRPLEFLNTSAKRLLQQYLPDSRVLKTRGQRIGRLTSAASQKVPTVGATDEASRSLKFYHVDTGQCYFVNDRARQRVSRKLALIGAFAPH